tara:strand:- start:1616 stop:2569 length:954 start_codon:yes stop_codon:yes gene_type:complete
VPVTLKNIKNNLKFLKKGKSIIHLRKKNNGKIVIVIASGPSLRRNNQIKYLKKYRNFFYLVASDGALYYLLSNNIIPDLVVTLDPHPSRIVRWFGDTSLTKKKITDDDYFRRQDLEIKFNKEIKSNKKMIALFNKFSNRIKVAVCTSSSNAVIKRLLSTNAKIFWWNPYLDDTKKKNSLSKKIFKLNKLPLINTGGNVGSASWMIADQVFNSKKILLLGMDYSYYLNTPLRATQYYDAIDKITKSNKEKKKFYKTIYNPFVKKSFYTDHVYLWYKKILLEMIENTSSITVNCSGAGILFGKKIQWTSLRNFCKKIYG